MKYFLTFFLVTFAASSAFAQAIDEQDLVPTTIAAYTPQPKIILRDTYLRSDKNTNLRSDFMQSIPIAANDFATLAPASGGLESSSTLKDTNLRSDKNTILRSDRQSTPIVANDFATLAPASGGLESGSTLKDANLRSDKNTNLRSDWVVSEPRY